MTTQVNAKIATETDSDEESSTYSGEYEESTGSTNSYSYNTYRSEDNFGVGGCFNGADQKWESDGETDVTLFEILEAVDHAVDSVVDVIIPIPKETNEDRVALPDNTKERKIRPVLADEDMGMFNKVFPSSPRKVQPVPKEEKISRGRGLFYKKSLNIDTDNGEGGGHQFKSFSPRMLSPKRFLSPRRKKKVDLEPADTDETSTDGSSFSPRVFSPKRILSPKREKYTVSAPVDTDETAREEDSSYFGGTDLAAMLQAMSPKNANAYDDNDDESIISKTLNWMSGEQPKKEQKQQEVTDVTEEKKKNKRRFFKRNKKRSTKQSAEEVKYRPEGAEYIWSFTNKNENHFDANKMKYEDSTTASSYSDDTKKKRVLFRRRRKRQGKSKYSVFQ